MKLGTPGFNGERLKAAREARGIITATSFAEMIGVTRAAVSQYECGVQTPSPAVMRTISERLNLPVQQFLLPTSAPAGTLFFRSMASTTQTDRVRVKRQFEWLRDIADAIANYVKFPKVDVPKADVPRNPLQITDDMIEECATNLRRHWKLGNGPISDVALLLENKGIILASIDSGSDRIDAFSHWSQSHNRPFVILDSAENRTAVRNRANAAHELGHMVLHRNLTEADLRRPAIFKEIERQAFRFGAAFLLPSTTFLRELYGVTLAAFQDLKPRWKVAMSLMLKRAEDLEVISEAHSKRLWINMTRRGWKRSEPFDDQIPVEKPRFLRRCVELLIERGKISRQELPLMLHLAPRDIERLVGLPSNWLEANEQFGDIEELEPTIIKLPFRNDKQ